MYLNSVVPVKKNSSPNIIARMFTLTTQECDYDKEGLGKIMGEKKSSGKAEERVWKRGTWKRDERGF